MTEKIDIIKKIYYDPAGYSSKKVTLEGAKKVDKSIKMKDVGDFFDKYIEQETKHHGQNSFVAPEAYYEYEVDLFFVNNLKEQKFNVGLLCIDIFSKWMEVIPIKTKEEGDVASGLLEAFNKMGQSPKHQCLQNHYKNILTIMIFYILLPGVLLQLQKCQ